MEDRRPGGLRYVVLWLGRVVLTSGCVMLSAGVGLTQSETKSAPVGVETITGILTGHKQWTFYWDRAHIGRPRRGVTTTDQSPSATLEFMRVGRRVIGHAHNDRVHHTECDFDVAVREDGFTFEGCWGADKSMTYDPDDREYPFKGRIGGVLLWLAPS